MARELERIDRRITAHEPDDCALKRSGQVAPFDYLNIQSRRRETGAACNEEVRNAIAIKFEFIDRRRSKLRGAGLKRLHTCGSVWKLASHIKRVDIERVPAMTTGSGRNEGVSMFNPGPFGHSLQQPR